MLMGYWENEEIWSSGCTCAETWQLWHLCGTRIYCRGNDELCSETGGMLAGPLCKSRPAIERQIYISV